MDDLRCRQFFLDADSTIYHRHYEAWRAIFVEGMPQDDAAARYGYTPGSMRQLVHRFRTAMRSGSPPPFFKSPGLAGRPTPTPATRTTRSEPLWPMSEPVRSRT